MDHRRKHAGNRSLGEEDYEAGALRLSASHNPPPRRSRLSNVALLSLGLLFVFVVIVTFVHFSHVNTLESLPAKGASKASVVLRREDRELHPGKGNDGAESKARTSTSTGNQPDGSPHQSDLGDNDDDGAMNDEPINEGGKDDDGAANDEPVDKGEKDDDGAANDEPMDKGEKDDDGAANDEPVDRGEKDDDGAANDEPVDKGEKDDDGAANDEAVDRGDKDDDGAANDEPVDKGEKDDDGAANDEPVDKGDKDDDGAANDEPVDKGDKDDDGAANDEPVDKGDKDDDGAANDAPGDVDKDDVAEQSGASNSTASGVTDKNSTTVVTDSNAATSMTASTASTTEGGPTHDGAKGGELPEERMDYEDVGFNDLYVDVNPDDPDYDANQDVDLETHQKQGKGELQQQQQQEQAPTVAPNTCASLSRELLELWAENNTVLMAFTNSIMFKLFGNTWLYHVRKAGIKYWVFAVADNETAKLVRSAGADHCFLVQENEIDNTAAAFSWGSRSWMLHTWQKVLTVRHVHHLGFHVINSDMDVVWFRNPLEHFLIKYPLADYWVSMDPITTANPLGDDGPEVGVSTHHYMNTGVYFLRQTPGGRALIDKWYEIRNDMQRAGSHDQDGLYMYFKDSSQVVDRHNRVSIVVDGKTKLAQLPATLFQNGYSHCINQIHKIHGLDPFEVHFVWVWGGNVGKINRMREQMYFIDPPEYYSDGYFLSFDVESVKTPEGFNDWSDTEAMVQTHLKAMDTQLTDTWHALALAALLNRTIILPKMKCFCIQNWFENPQCRLPGEPLTRFPLSPACPADYVFNMEALDVFNLSGRHVDFREFSFLDNERTPAEVKERPLVVVASPNATAATLKGDTLTIPVGLKSSPLLAALQPFLTPDKAPKRLHFPNPRMAFGGWSDEAESQEFDLHVNSLPVNWCCRPDAVAKELHVDVKHQLVMHQALPEGIAGVNGTGAGSSRRLQMSSLIGSP